MERLVLESISTIKAPKITETTMPLSTQRRWRADSLGAATTNENPPAISNTNDQEDRSEFAGESDQSALATDHAASAPMTMTSGFGQFGRHFRHARHEVEEIAAEHAVKQDRIAAEPAGKPRRGAHDVGNQIEQAGMCGE